VHKELKLQKPPLRNIESKLYNIESKVAKVGRDVDATKMVCDALRCGAPLQSIDEDSSDVSSDFSVGSFELVQNLDAASFPCGPIKCFVPNTGFKSPNGHLLLVQHLRIGDEILLSDGGVSRVSRIQLYPADKNKPCELVDLTTNRGVFRVSANHRIATANSEGMPCEIRSTSQMQRGDRLFVGSKQRVITKVVRTSTRTDLSSVSFTLDAPVETFMVPHLGMQTRGEPLDDQANANAGSSFASSFVVDLRSMFAEISEEDLLRAMPLRYDE